MGRQNPRKPEKLSPDFEADELVSNAEDLYSGIASDKIATYFPRAYKILVGGYLFLGSLSLVFGIHAALRGVFYVDSTALCLVTGLGLLSRKRPWRIVGMITSSLTIINCLFSLFILLSWDENQLLWQDLVQLTSEAGSNTLLFGLSVLFFLSLTFCFLSFFLLTRPPVRALFHSPVSHNTKHRRAFILLFCVLTLSRETGGLRLDFFNTTYNSRTTSQNTNPSLAELDAKLPLIIEIKGLSSDTIIVITKLDMEKVGSETKTSWEWKRFDGSLVPGAKQRYEGDQTQSVILDASQIHFTTLYHWLPLIKWGDVSFVVNLSGTGKLESYQESVNGGMQLTMSGVSSAYNFRKNAKNRIIAMVVKKVMNSMKEE